MPQQIGYARVSTQDQSPNLQIDALKAAGCDPVLIDQGLSGAKAERPALSRALRRLETGDVLVVWKLDRLGRSLSHLIETVGAIETKGAHFRSLSENIDTTSSGGRLVFHIMGAMAEFERALIVERTKAGMAVAKARGVKMGRKKLLDSIQLKQARMLLENGESVGHVAQGMRVSRSTLQRALRNAGPSI